MMNNYKTLTDNYYKNILIVLKSLIIGTIVGVIIVLYRLSLTYAEQFAFYVYGFLKNNLLFFPLAIIVLFFLAYLNGYLVSKNKMISGSGIPQVEGILKGYFQDRKSWIHTLCGKFLGGIISIVGGLSLGREGPSIQLGACVAEGLGKKIARGRLERKILMVSGASAGLAAAFNAPMAGIIFALEEMFKYFSPVILLSMMSASVMANFISNQVFGLSPIFNFEIIKEIPLNNYWIIIILGILLGLMGVFYNYVLLKTKILYGKIKLLNTRIIIPFMFAGLLGIIFPIVLGSGHRIIEELSIQNGIIFLIIIFSVKFIFSMISFGSGAPGGIFFPLIILGAVIGAIFSGISIRYFGFDQELYNNIIILAMAGYFAAIVRAPITGIILIMEMTGSFNQMLPLTVVSVTSYVVADIIKSQPIYEALLEDLLQNENSENKKEHCKKILVEFIVKHGSKFGNCKVKDIEWPGRSLLVEIKQGDRNIIPKGDITIKEGDYLTILTDINNESKIKEIFNEMNEPFSLHGRGL